MLVTGHGKEGVMPKEIIRDEAGMYNVQVGWEREKYVQVGLSSADGRPLEDLLRAESEEYTVDGSGKFRSVWGTLDRASCNQLIRVLRRARDQAFGRDE